VRYLFYGSLVATGVMGIVSDNHTLSLCAAGFGYLAVTLDAIKERLS
jgi:hypothetical protein